MKRVPIVLFIALLGVPNALAGLQKKAGAEQPSQEASKAQPPAPNYSKPIKEEFVIGPEDVLSINVWKEPELSTKAVVRPDGKISLPLVDEIQASGLTPRQLQERIQEKLKDFVSAPRVTVIVSEIHSQVVYLMGEVGKPGPYTFASPITVMELLARAGGFREYAKTKNIKIFRNEGAQQVQIPFNYKEFVEGKNLKQNITLKNGDVVVVP